MSFFVLESVKPTFQRRRRWVSTKEQATTTNDGLVICRDPNLARIVSTSGFRLIVNPKVSDHLSGIKTEGSRPVSRLEAASLLGVTAMIIDTWQKHGKLRGYYMGNTGPIFAHKDVMSLVTKRAKNKKEKEEVKTN